MTGSVVIDAYLARLPVRPEVAPLRSPYGTNVLASLVYPDGRTTILKVYRKEGAARNEDAALRAVAAACTEREVPQVRFFGVVAERHVMEMTCVPGRVPTIEHDIRGHDTASRLGALLRRVHHVAVPSGSWGPLWPEEQPAAPSWYAVLHERFHGRIGRLLAAGAIDDAAAEAAAGRLAAAQSRLAGYVTRHLVHGDLNVSNLLVADDGAVGLIDFERARAGHWVYDTVKLFSETFDGCPDCIRAFMDGHGCDVEAIRADALVYRLVYSVDMAAYLLGELHHPEDHQLLARLLRFIRRPHDLWTDA